MQEVSRVGAQGVTSKSKLLAWEMPDLHTGGLRVDCGALRRGKDPGWEDARRGCGRYYNSPTFNAFPDPLSPGA